MQKGFPFSPFPLVSLYIKREKVKCLSQGKNTFLMKDRSRGILNEKYIFKSFLPPSPWKKHMECHKKANVRDEKKVQTKKKEWSDLWKIAFWVGTFFFVMPFLQTKKGSLLRSAVKLVYSVDILFQSVSGNGPLMDFGSHVLVHIFNSWKLLRNFGLA